MSELTKKRLLFALVGLLYGLGLAIWGVLISGGGHVLLPGFLALAPVPVGLFLWPAFGLLSADLSKKGSRIALLLLLLVHYVGFGADVYVAGWSEFYWLRIGMHNSGFVLCLVISFAVYLAAQLFLWLRFAQALLKYRSPLSHVQLDSTPSSQ